MSPKLLILCSISRKKAGIAKDRLMVETSEK